MAITLENPRQIEPIELKKVHVKKWFQTEDTTPPYKITIQAEVILYGHDQEGQRVYDPTGSRTIAVPDWRNLLSEQMKNLPPEKLAEIQKHNEDYIKALAFMVELQTDFGKVNSQ